jgi:hypothetical protein
VVPGRQLPALAKVPEVIPKDQRSALLSLIECAEKPRPLEHADCLGDSRPGTVKQFHHAVDRHHRMLWQPFGQAQAEDRGIVSGV